MVPGPFKVTPVGKAKPVVVTERQVAMVGRV